MKRWLFIAWLIGASCSGAELVRTDINWPEFLARHDLIWERLPTEWREGAFIGNGLLGAMIYSDADGALRWEIGRSDVIDHRKGDNNPLVNKARLPIGSFLLHPVGRVSAGTVRLDLWNAVVDGTLKTDKGAIEWRSFAHAQDNVMIVTLTTSRAEALCRWEWEPAVSGTTRPRNKGRPADYQPNPAPTIEDADGCHVCVQSLLEGGEYATAWQEVKPAANQRVIAISIDNSWPGKAARSEAVAAVKHASERRLSALVETHRRWWHEFYPESFVSIPDTRLESFYWIQMYKLASATRADRPALDLMGPWFHKTLWPGIWWNLNIQLAYSPVYTANRLELGESLCRMLENNVSNLVENVQHYKDYDFKDDSAVIARVTSYDCAGGMFKGQRGCPEIGNLTWACQNYWRQCRYAADDGRLREKMLPLLRRAINFYLHMLQKGNDGKYHLPCTYSPEFGPAPDCNYDLSLLRWGCATLVESCERLHIDDPLLPRWKDVLANLTAFPTDANGFMIGCDSPFNRSHRHYSHLLMFYPLYVLNWDQRENRDLIARSVNHWTGMKGAFAGYSYTGAASMFASMGRGEDALKFLKEGLHRFVTANTMYLEADSPCIETPLASTQSIQDMLLQSWGGTIRIFPAVPESWPDATFHNLRAEGGFLISAVRQHGKTQWVRIKNLMGEPCRVLIDGATKELHLVKGEETILGTGDGTITPIPVEPGQCNSYGCKLKTEKK